MSKLRSRDFKDLVNGLYVTVVAAILTAIGDLAQTQQMPTMENLKTILYFGAVAGVSYMIKRFTSDQNGTLPFTK